MSSNDNYHLQWFFAGLLLGTVMDRLTVLIMVVSWFTITNRSALPSQEILTLSLRYLQEYGYSILPKEKPPLNKDVD